MPHNWSVLNFDSFLPSPANPTSRIEKDIFLMLRFIHIKWPFSNIFTDLASNNNLLCYHCTIKQQEDVINCGLFSICAAHNISMGNWTLGKNWVPKNHYMIERKMLTYLVEETIKQPKTIKPNLPKASAASTPSGTLSSPQLPTTALPPPTLFNSPHLVGFASTPPMYFTPAPDSPLGSPTSPLASAPGSPPASPASKVTASDESDSDEEIEDDGEHHSPSEGEVSEGQQRGNQRKEIRGVKANPVGFLFFCC